VGTVIAYLDASVLVSLFIPASSSARADDVLRTQTPEIVVSDLAAAEFASALSRRVRMGELQTKEARSLLAEFDQWLSAAARRVELVPSDVAIAASFLRRFDTTLRTPDAIHVALAQRIGANLFTFDKKLSVAARALKVEVVEV
jgi:predicted nucleic acid-binding protein